MTAPSYRQAQWLISGRDFTVHAFHHPAPPGRDFLEALCDHTVPLDLVEDLDATELQPPYCGTCLRRFGEEIARPIHHWHD